MSDADRLEEAMKEGKEGRFFAHMAIPTQKDIEQALLERKKRELLSMYAIDDDDDDDTEATQKKE
jgi:pre-mRNA-splicing factor ISY1